MVVILPLSLSWVCPIDIHMRLIEMEWSIAMVCCSSKQYKYLSHTAYIFINKVLPWNSVWIDLNSVILTDVKCDLTVLVCNAYLRLIIDVKCDLTVLVFNAYLRMIIDVKCDLTVLVVNAYLRMIIEI